MRTVGLRKPSSGGLEHADKLLNTVVELREGRPLFPRGVYRFKSFEEADAWSLQMITRPSSGSQK
jgi:hypothetical protein